MPEHFDRLGSDSLKYLKERWTKYQKSGTAEKIEQGLKETIEKLPEGEELGLDGVKAVVERCLDTIKNLKPQNLMDELANSGVKYNPDDVIAVTKMPDGKLVWLEKGNANAGLEHILARHAEDFAAKGVNDIPSFLYDILSTNPITIGTNEKGLFADYIFNGNKYRIAYGTNGYIVSFFPVK